MRPTLYLRYMLRESRGSLGRLVFFSACLSIGVAAVVAVSGISDSLDQTLRGEARELLAADLVVESTRPLPPELDEQLDRIAGARRTEVKELSTVVAVPGADGDQGTSVLTELKVVGAGYPFYGEVDVEPARPLAELLGAETVVVAPALLERLDLQVGDTLLIGGQPFRISGVVRGEPDRLDVSFSLGPRVFLAPPGLERAGLERFGSRILHRRLVQLPAAASRADVQATAQQLREALSDSGFMRVETYVEAQPILRRGLQRAERFLGLIALLSLLIGGIGVAQAVQSWLAGRLDSIAVLKSLGVRPREILGIYAGQTALLGLLGSMVGGAVGLAVQGLVPSLLGDLIPREALRVWQPAALAQGVALGVGVAVLFGLPPLLSILRVPPSRVFRHDAEPLGQRPVVRWAAFGLLAVGVFGMAWFQSGSWITGVQFSLGIGAATGMLALTALGLARLVGRMPRRGVRVWIRHGLTALARPGAGTVGAIVAVGLGVLVVLSIHLVQAGLTDQLRADLPSDAPSAFVVDIQPDQWSGVRTILDEEGATHLQSAPVVVGRLRAVDGVAVETLLAGDSDKRRRRWVLTREQRMTYLERLPEDNTIVDGALWSDPALPEISIERDFAADLGASVGSALTFDIQGVPLDLHVTSLRTVVWESFGINFFLVVEPGVLEQAPQFRVAAARLSPGTIQQVQDRLVGRYPNVILLDVSQLLEKVASVMDRLGRGVRLLGGFTVLAGIAILGGAISAGSIRRGREVALLKTLGMTRRGVVAVFSVEYALIGLVAGVIGVCGAVVLAWFVLTRGLDADWVSGPGTPLLAVAASVLLTVVAGLVVSLRALSRRPIEVLRQ